MFPGFTPEYERFSDAADQAREARIWGGIHFRTACEVGQQLGERLADDLLARRLQPLRGR